MNNRLISFLKREKIALDKIKDKGDYLRGYEHAIDNVIDKIPNYTGVKQ